MSRRRYPTSPDDVMLDVDRGPSSTSTKTAKLVPHDEYVDRAKTRAGARQLDEVVEATRNLTRARRDRERAVPRDVTTEPRHPRMARKLAEPDGIRVPLSSRQRKARSVTKRAVQDRLTNTEYMAVSALIADEAQWKRLNDALSAAVGDAQDLDDDVRVDAQRVDRAIQKYERANDRGHVIYTNVELPQAINHANVDGFLRHRLRAARVALDRFTGGAHNLHEIEPADDRAGRIVALEIQTRRGLYLGRSDTVDDTTHLLPRGLRLKVSGSHYARYRRPDGTIGRRYVIQMLDIDS